MARSRNTGFTLIELLAALAVFGLMAVMAYGGLNGTIRAKEHLAGAQQRGASWQQGIYRLRADIESAVPRPIRDEFGTLQPALHINAAAQFAFTRAGRRNPLSLPRSSLERVAYTLQDGKLLRSALSTEPAQGTETDALVLLEGIEEMQWLFFDAGEKEWIETWPPLSQPGIYDLIPAAVQLRLLTKPYGELRLLFGTAGTS